MNVVKRQEPVALSTAYRWYALALLTVLNLLNYLDRNVIFALFEPIKRDLSLTDAQLGWLGSAYILVFSVAALPFGVLSDLRSRRAVIAWGVSLWSAFTVLAGLARGFGSLFVTRAAVGIGEAAFGPASQSLVADYFSGKRRAFAMGILSAGLSLGGVLGLWLGGKLEAVYGWRVTFMAVGLPGFALAVLAVRLVDPTRVLTPVKVTHLLRELRVGVDTLIRQFNPLLVTAGLGAIAALWADRGFGASSETVTMIFAIAAGLGLALNLQRWVRQIRQDRIDDTPFGGGVSEVFVELVRATRLVFRTPTLVWVFLSGALVSFGLNGLVGWGSSFASRELGWSAAESAAHLGEWGLISGTAGTLFGGVFADWLRKYTVAGRVWAGAIGLLIGGALAVWLVTIRDPQHFVTVFAVAFFFLTWYNGPLAATIFDVVAARVSATVVGAYLLFTHVAGDAIAFPLVGALSDRFGIDRAMLILPVVTVIGGLALLPAVRTVGGDGVRMTGEFPVVVVEE
ncbi:MAG TPA: MFS transporter [Gemmatimonadales bacterium]|nr:MFS transporter [Gemmatimonadales bacterium]